MPTDLAPNNPYGLTLARPALAAAGCFGYGVEYAKLVDLDGIGGIVTRTTTLHARRAGPPRLIETPAGLLWVASGANPGLRAVLAQHAPVWATWDTPVILSIAGQTTGEVAQIGAALEGVAGIAGVELNLAESGAQAGSMVKAARGATQLPLLAKLPPLDVEPLLALARIAVAAGADALTVSGCPRALYVAPTSGEQLAGWLCGPAIQPLALRLVAAIAAAETSVPLIGGGGIASAEDAARFMAVGAAAVQVGAALLAAPALLASIG